MWWLPAIWWTRCSLPARRWSTTIPATLFRLQPTPRHGFGHAAVFHIERHQHGHAGGFGRRRADDRKDPTLTPDTVKARLMKTASKNFPVMQHRHRSDHGPDLHRLLRHVHGGRRICGHRRRADELRSSVRLGRIAASHLQLAAQTALLVPNLTETWWTSPTWSFQRVGAGDARSRSSRNNGHLGKQRGLGHERGLGNQCRLGNQRCLGHQCRLGHQRRVGHQHTGRTVSDANVRCERAIPIVARSARQAPCVRTHIALGARDVLLGAWRTGNASDPLRFASFAAGRGPRFGAESTLAGRARAPFRSARYSCWSVSST